MPNPDLLTTLTIVVAVVVVLVLVVYLGLIIFYLYRAGNHLNRLNAALAQTVQHTQPLPDYLTTINQALGALDQGLDAVDDNLVGVADVLQVKP